MCVWYLAWDTQENEKDAATIADFEDSCRIRAVVGILYLFRSRYTKCTVLPWMVAAVVNSPLAVVHPRRATHC